MIAPVTVTLSGVTTVGLWAAILGVAGIFLRQIVPWKTQAAAAEARLRESLIERVERLEFRLDRQQIRHDAEKRLLTHKLRNMTANFDSILLMLEMNPDRVSEIVVAIKEQRARQMVAEAQESAVIYADELKGEAPEKLA